MKRLVIGLCGVVSLVLAAPAQASTPSLSTVLSHTHAANVALTRAVSEFDAHALGAGKAQLKTNRRQIGIAVSQTAQLIQNATTPAERLAAAKAVVAVAKQTSADERALAKVDRALPKGSRIQTHVIRAAAKDTARNTTAIDRLNALLGSVPASAQPGLTNAIARITLTHGGAVKQLGADVTSHTVGATAKATAAADLVADIKGQHHAIDLLQAIMPLLPANAQPGITTALGAIASRLDAEATRLTHVKTNAPRALRATVALAIVRARHAAADARS
jgi:hypothetical protein